MIYREKTTKEESKPEPSLEDGQFRGWQKTALKKPEREKENSESDGIEAKEVSRRLHKNMKCCWKAECY